MNNTHEDTQKKIAVISGAFGYVGFEVSKKLAQEGMILAMLYHMTDEVIVAQKLSELQGTGHRAYVCDLKNAEEVERTLDDIGQDLGAFSVCVHAAGEKPKRKSLIASSVDDLKTQFENNIVPSFNFLSSCAKRLKEHQEGVVIGITTVGIVVPEATRSLGAYIPAKYAIQGMLTMLKEELAPFSVRVYSVAPGFMHGGMNDDIPKAFAEMVRGKSPTKKLTTAADVAEKVSYLCGAGSKDEKVLTFIVSEEVTGS